MPQLRKRKQTIETGVFRAQAAIRENSYNEEDHTMVVEFASEYPVLRYSWRNDEYYNEVLDITADAIDFARVKAGASVIKNHNQWEVDDVVGVTLDGWIEGKKAVARIKLHVDEDDKEVMRFIKKVKNGTIRNISVGYTIYEIVRTQKKKEDTPVYRAVKWSPDEISFVAVPADPTVGARSRQVAKKEALKMRESNNLHKTILRMNEDEEDVDVDLDEEENVKPPKKRKAPVAKKRAAAPDDEEDEDDEPVTKLPKNSKPLSKAELRAAVTAEKARQADIRSIGAKFGMPQEFIDEHIEDDTDVTEFRKLTMDKWDAADPASSVRNHNKAELKVNKDEADKRIKVRAHALAVRSGVMELEGIKDEALRSEVATEQKFGLFRMAERGLRQAGIDTDTMSGSEIARRAIAPQSTSQFPETLNALVNVIYLQKYEEEQDDAWREISTSGTLSDFKEYGAIRSWGLDNLKQVNETEEYEQIPLRDAQGEKMRLYKHGGIVSLSWEAIVNDDLGHFTSLISDLGISSGRTLKDKFWSRLLENGQRGPLMADGKALYHVDHNNLMGAQASLNETVIDSIRVAMRNTKVDANGKRVAFRPSILVVNPVEFAIARRYNNSTVSVDATSKSSLLESLVAGTFDKVIESENIPAGYRYVFDKPSRNPVLRVNYLDGERRPVIERHDEFRTDSINWKARYVFGISAVSWQATELLPNA